MLEGADHTDFSFLEHSDIPWPKTMNAAANK